MKKKLLLMTMLVFIGIFNVNIKALSVVDVPAGTYIIGDHMLTRKVDEESGYNGVLTTKKIMLASQTTNGDESDMMIYLKKSDGSWIDGLTGDPVDDVDLSEIKYYNFKKIPEQSLTYNEKNVLDDSVEYSLKLKNFSNVGNFTNLFNSSTSFEKIELSYDLFGSDNVDDLEYINPNYDNDFLIESNINLVDPYKVSVEKNSSYYYKPIFYIEDVEFKIYLQNDEILALDSGVEVNTQIVDNKLNVSLTGIDDYTIDSVSLYVPKNNDNPHLSVNDISNALKQVTNKDELLVNSNMGFMLGFLAMMTEINYENHDYQLANIKIGDWGQEVSISDLGNSENEENTYVVVVNYKDSENETEKVVVSNVINGVVSQEILPEGNLEFMTSEGEELEEISADLLLLSIISGTTLNIAFSLALSLNF